MPAAQMWNTLLDHSVDTLLLWSLFCFPQMQGFALRAAAGSGSRLCWGRFGIGHALQCPATSQHDTSAGSGGVEYAAGMNNCGLCTSAA